MLVGTPSSSAVVAVTLAIAVVVVVVVVGVARSGGAECRARRTASWRRAREGVKFKGGGAGGGLSGG